MTALQGNNVRFILVARIAALATWLWFVLRLVEYVFPNGHGAVQCFMIVCATIGAMIIPIMIGESR